MRKYISLIFVLCVFVSFQFPQTVSALSCAPPRPVKDEINSSSIVFMGTALNSNPKKVKFQVKTIWKGSTDRIKAGVFVSDMWKEIEAGQDYLIFVNERDGQLEANICGNSNLWSTVNTEQFNEQLGTGEIMEQQKSNITWILSGVFIIVIGAFITLRNRKR